ICARLAEKFSREKGQNPFSLKLRAKRGLGLPGRPAACLSSRAHARDLSQDGGSHEVVWCPIARSRGPSTFSRLGMTRRVYLALYIYIRHPGRFRRGCEKFEADKREFLARSGSKNRRKLGSPPQGSKISQILKFP